MKILVVDDDFVSRNVLSGAVEKLGHECVVCEDGTEAWSVFQKTPFQVVLSDWMMPGMDGLALCHRIREFSTQDYCYFIMLSSLDKKHHVLKGLEAGADDYLTKPLDLDELRARLLSAERVTSLHRNLMKAQTVAVQNSKLAAVGQLAAGVAHELNSPLGAMKLTLESARKRAKEESVARKISIALRALGSMQEVVSQLLETSVLRTGQMGVCDLSGVVRHTLSLLRAHPRAEQVEMECRLQETAEVLLPAAELQLVVSILVSNAVDAVLTEGARGRRVLLTGRNLDESTFELHVADQGRGMEKEVLARVFEPFFTTKPVGQGVGLGLSMVRNILEQRGGRIAVVSSLEEETTFTLSLPTSTA